MKRLLTLAAVLLLAVPARSAGLNVSFLFQNITATSTVPPSPPGLVQFQTLNLNGGPAYNQAYQLVCNGIGSISATAQIVGSNDGTTISTYGATITASGVTSANTSAVGTIPFAYLGGFLTAISGTNTSCTLTVSG